MTAPDPIVAPSTDAPRGVGGWLLLLCVILVGLIPVFTALAASLNFRALPIDADAARTAAMIEAVLSLVLAALSVRAGWRLWTISEGAVRSARQFLWIYFGFHVVAAGVPFLFGAGDRTLLGHEVLMDLFRGGIFLAVWQSYLKHSVRVRNTYLHG